MKRIRISILALCLLCLAGCGSKEAPTKEQEQNPQAVDWKSTGFAIQEEVREEQGLWTMEYIAWKHAGVVFEPKEEGLYIQEAGICGEKIYRLAQVLKKQKGADVRYVLEVYDTSAMQESVTEIDGAKLGMGQSFVTGMSVVAPGEYVLQTTVNDGQNRYLVYTDLEGQAEMTDILPVYTQKGIEEASGAFECIVDREGNSYARAGKSWQPYRDLHILNREGQPVMEYRGGEYDEIQKPLFMSTGEPVFPIYDQESKSCRMVWFDTDKKEMRVLAHMEKEVPKQVYGIQGEDIYYESEKGIVKWNIRTGDRVLLYSLQENGVNRWYQTMLVLREGKAPLLRMYGNMNGENQDWLVVLSEQEVERTDAVEVVSLLSASSGVQTAVGVASRKNPAYAYGFKGCTEAEAEEFRTRVMADLMAGNGPDVLYVSLEDMRILQEMGVLADLKTLLSEESRQQILPGILEMGTVNEEYVGLPIHTSVYTVMTLKSIWDKPTWSLTDVMKLMNTGKYTEFFCQGTTTFAPRALLTLFVQAGIQDKLFMDGERGESYFESELFQEVLRMAKAYGDNPIRTDTYVGKGECLGMYTGGSLLSIKELEEEYGEEYFFVGELTGGRSGNYVKSDGVLVVNRNVSNPQAVAAFLECVLCDEVQHSHTGVALEQSVKRALSDGTPAMDKYKALLESCVPYPEEYDKIVKIVWEEGQAYIEGDKSASEVAVIIDNRIQLYLDENG